MKLVRDDRNTPMPILSYGTVHTIAFSSTSQQSSVFDAEEVVVVRIAATQECFVAVGENPTASTSTIFLPAGYVEYIGIPAGHRIAAIRSGSDGVLSITELV